MGKSVYLFELNNVKDNNTLLVNTLLNLGYSLINNENEWGVYLEKLLNYGIIEVHVSEDRTFFRVAKPNSEKTIDIILQDVIELKKVLPDLIFYDCETKCNVDLFNNKTLRDNFIKSQKEFLKYFSDIVNMPPVRGDEVFKIK